MVTMAETDEGILIAFFFFIYFLKYNFTMVCIRVKKTDCGSSGVKLPLDTKIDM